MNPRMFLMGSAAAATLLASACMHSRRTEPLAPPLTSSDPQFARGEKVFFQHCHACHPNGATGLGPAFNNKPLPVFLMKFQVRHGLGVMPGFNEAKIPDADLDALMTYIVTLRRNRAAI